MSFIFLAGAITMNGIVNSKLMNKLQWLIHNIVIETNYHTLNIVYCSLQQHIIMQFKSDDFSIAYPDFTTNK